MRILAIDGNYFANRCLGILNQGDNINNIETPEERQKFKEGLKVQLIKLWQSFGMYFDNFVIVADSFSWRKQIPVFKPWYVTSKDLEDGMNIEYKGYRKVRREESKINYQNFDADWKEFVDENEDILNIIKIRDLEGDDILKLLSDKFLEDDIECCIFATDKDLTQIINDKVFMFSNTKSKQHPNGYFIMNDWMYKHYIDCGNMLQRIMVRGNDAMTFNDIMSINIFDYQTPVYRHLNEGIMIAEPNKVILNKIVCGDNSDNILPIIRWKYMTKDGSQNCVSGNMQWRNVTEKMLIKAFDNSMIFYTNEMCGKIINDSEYLIDLINNLIIITKVKTTIHPVRELFNHNKKMVFLDRKYYPISSIDEFDVRYSELMNDGWQRKMGLSDLKKALNMSAAQINDRAQNILQSSIPDFPENF